MSFLFLQLSHAKSSFLREWKQKIKMMQLGSMLYFVLRTATPVTTPNS